MNTQDIRVRGDGPVIMVDDADTDFMIAARAFRKSILTNDFIHFASGFLFLEHCDAVQRGEMPMPALVLMDINMPGMSGFETVQKLRKRSTFAELPILVMLSSSVDPADRAMAKEIHVNGFFTKPLVPSEYVDLFNGCAPATA